jgi:hypothetical protein
MNSYVIADVIARSGRYKDTHDYLRSTLCLVYSLLFRRPYGRHFDIKQTDACPRRLFPIASLDANGVRVLVGPLSWFDRKCGQCVNERVVETRRRFYLRNVTYAVQDYEFGVWHQLK